MSSMPPPYVIFDRRLVRARCLRAAALHPSTFLMERVAQELSDRLASVLRRFEWAVDLGTPTDAVRRELARGSNIGAVVAANAFAGCLHQRMASEGFGAGGLAVAVDE